MFFNLSFSKKCIFLLKGMKESLILVITLYYIESWEVCYWVGWGKVPQWRKLCSARPEKQMRIAAEPCPHQKVALLSCATTYRCQCQAGRGWRACTSCISQVLGPLGLRWGWALLKVVVLEMHWVLEHNQHSVRMWASLRPGVVLLLVCFFCRNSQILSRWLPEWFSWVTFI